MIDSAPVAARWARRRRQSLSFVAAVMCVAALAGCGRSGYQEDTYPIVPGHKKPQPIGHGLVGKNTWTLLASQNGEGQLCMWVRWRPYAGVQDEGCGFGSNQVNDEGRGTEPTDTTQTKDGTVLAFGPSPARAVRAILSTPRIAGTDCRATTMSPTIVPITHQMPDWFPPHGTGWFIVTVPAGALDCVIDVHFLDAHGHAVAQPNDY
jgi:hypothetical protein